MNSPSKGSLQSIWSFVATGLEVELRPETYELFLEGAKTSEDLSGESELKASRTGHQNTAAPLQNEQVIWLNHQWSPSGMSFGGGGNSWQ